MCSLAQALSHHELIWIVNDLSPVLPEGARAYRVSHAERDVRVLWNLVEFAAILSREQPNVLLSTGAGPAVPAALVAKLAGIPVIYVEASCAVTELTVTGRLMRHLADSFFVQWQPVSQKAPWARFVGGLL